MRSRPLRLAAASGVPIPPNERDYFFSLPRTCVRRRTQPLRSIESARCHQREGMIDLCRSYPLHDSSFARQFILCQEMVGERSPRRSRPPTAAKARTQFVASGAEIMPRRRRSVTAPDELGELGQAVDGFDPPVMSAGRSACVAESTCMTRYDVAESWSLSAAAGRVMVTLSTSVARSSAGEEEIAGVGGRARRALDPHRIARVGGDPDAFAVGGARGPGVVGGELHAQLRIDRLGQVEPDRQLDGSAQRLAGFRLVLDVQPLGGRLAGPSHEGRT